MDHEIEEKDPYFKISWFSRHPGDEVETKILSLLDKKTNNAENDLFYLGTFKGAYIFLKWISKVRGGLTITYPVFGETDAIMPVHQWLKYIWEFHVAKISTLNNLIDLHDNLTIDVEETQKINLDKEWLKSSLNGGKIEIFLDTKEGFIKRMLTIIESLPWSVYLLETGTLTENKFELKYRKAKGSINISMDDLFSQIQNPHNMFWEQIQYGMTNIRHLKADDRSNRMLTYIGLILYIQRDDQDPLESLKLIKDHVLDILTVSVETGVSFITDTFGKVAVLHPSYDTCKLLLKVADKIQETNQTDLIKLAEGTALQIAISLEEPKKREEIFLDVTKRSKKWGSSHLIAYIQSITGILRDTVENRKILSKIVESCEDTLRDSWDGQLCLVESYLIAEHITKAIVTRLEASKLLSDKIMRAEDIFGAISWSLTQTINEQDLIELTNDSFNQAVLDFPKDQILLTQMESLVNACLENSKLHYLFNVINQVNSPQIGLDIDLRMQLISLFEQMLSTSKKYIQISIHVQLNKFNLYIENPTVYSYDAAESLLRSIYNSVNPSKSYANELIAHITNWIILSSAKANRVDLVDEARMRFDLLINDEEYSRVNLRDIYAKAGRIRQKLPKSQLKKNGLGVNLFNEAIELAHPFKESEFLMDILPDAKSLAIKKQAYDIFVRFAILEITLVQHLELDWIEALLDSTDVLVDNGALEGARQLFDNATSQTLSQEQKQKLLSKQLSYVEIEPDLFTAHEIYEKRNELINLKSGTFDKKTQEELLDHYRFGISELMSKGDIDHLSDLVLQAIKYCVTNNISSGAEFSNILKDNFDNFIDTYRENKSSKVYKSLLSLLRKINDNFTTMDINHSAQYSSIIIRTNLELYTETKKSIYIQRNKTLIRELARVIQDGVKNNLNIKPEIYEVLIYEINTALQKIEETNHMFGKLDAVNLAAYFFYNIDDTTALFSYLNDTLAYLKREIIKTKKSSSMIVVGLLFLSEVYLKIEADIIMELCIPLQQQALRLLDVILTLPMSKELSTMMNHLKDRMESAPQQTFQEYPFEIESMLQAIDAN